MKHTLKLLKVLKAICLVSAILFGVGALVVLIFGIAKHLGTPSHEESFLYMFIIGAIACIALSAFLVYVYVLYIRAYNELSMKFNEPVDTIVDGEPNSTVKKVIQKVEEKLAFGDIVETVDKYKCSNGVVIPYGCLGKVVGVSDADFPKVEFVLPRTKEKIIIRFPRDKLINKNK